MDNDDDNDGIPDREDADEDGVSDVVDNGFVLPELSLIENGDENGDENHDENHDEDHDENDNEDEYIYDKI